MPKKPKPKNKKPSEVWKKYIVKENKVEKKQTCPKCGPGNFLGIHNNRLYCGKCKYVEMKNK